VLEAHRTNTVMQEGEFAWQAPWMWKYHLRVTLPNNAPYETTCNICAELGEGQQVQVAAAPHNRKRVTIDVGQGRRHGGSHASPNGTEDPELAALRAMEAAQPAWSTSVQPSGTGSDALDPVKRLQALADLHDRGALTDAEFAAAKSQVLSENRP
jgi:Short C-terminal domain